jgi:hypothetical protein
MRQFVNFPAQKSVDVFLLVTLSLSRLLPLALGRYWVLAFFFFVCRAGIPLFFVKGIFWSHGSEINTGRFPFMA